MFAQRLRQLRKAHGWTQKQLADRLFVDQTAISYWEQGKTNPDVERQLALADLFEVSIDYLFGRSDDPTPPGEQKKPTDIDSELSQILQDQDMQTIFNLLKQLNSEQMKKAEEHLNLLLLQQEVRKDKR